MNFIAIFPEWIDNQDLIRLYGQQAKSIIERHDLKPDLQLKGLIIDTAQIELKVEDVTNEYLQMRILSQTALPPIKNICACVAISRPQTVKKVLELAATFGIAELHFFRATKTVKSYLDSNVLKPEQTTENLIKGLEQSGLGRLPKILVHRNYRDFIKETLPKIVTKSAGKKYIAHPESLSEQVRGFDLDANNFILAFGPEAGFLDSELEDFKSLNFEAVNLGPAMLRLETAFALLVGRLY